MGNARLGLLELLNESVVLRAWQLSFVLSRTAGPLDGHREQILNRRNHSPCITRD